MRDGGRLSPCCVVPCVSISLLGGVILGSGFCRVFRRLNLGCPGACICRYNGRGSLGFSFSCPIVTGPTGSTVCRCTGFSNGGGIFHFGGRRRLHSVLTGLRGSDCSCGFLVRSYVPNSSACVHILAYCYSRGRGIHFTSLNEALLRSRAPATVNGPITVIGRIGPRVITTTAGFLRRVNCANFTGFSVGCSRHSNGFGFFRVGIHLNEDGFCIANDNFGAIG